jgi:ribosomal protein S18 acetylase RimI-like enzyme
MMNPYPLHIIPCNFENTAHCEALVRLMNEYITDKMGGGEPHNEEQKIRLVEGLKNHPSRLVYLAVSGDEFIGLINCFINFSTFATKPFVNIHDIVVTESWRNNRVGRQMLQTVIDKAAELDCSKVTLEVRADNHNARYLYDSMGFHDAEPRQYYWSKYL